MGPDINQAGSGWYDFDEKGVAAFHVLRRRRNEAQVFLYAFDLLELNGTDLRREPIEVRKATLAKRAPQRTPGTPSRRCSFPSYLQDGAGGIVSKRPATGRSPDWLKFKNPEAPAVRREAEEDWGK